MNLDHVNGLVTMPLEHLADLLPPTGVAFVTDDHLVAIPRVRSALAALGDVASIVVPVGEPSTETVTCVARRLRVERSTSVVALGGGSVLDTAKLAGLVASEDGVGVAAHLETVRPAERTIEVLAVPTTSGSGAEVTRTCVVTQDGRKTWAWNDALRPDRVLVDPTLTHGLPVTGTVATGLDALVHAVEAATAPAADRAAIDSGAAAFTTVLETLPVVVADGGDHLARSEMLEASICAGFAIDSAGTGIGHGIGHALASILPIPHGLGVAFGMWACLEWGIEARGDAYGRVDPDGDLTARVEALFDEIGFWHHLGRWAIRPLDPTRFRQELEQPAHRPMCLNNARPVEGDGLLEVSALVAEAWNDRFA